MANPSYTRNNARYPPRNKYSPKQSSFSPKNSKFQKKQIECWNCGGNHLRSQCPLLTDQQKKTFSDKKYKGTKQITLKANSASEN